MSFIQTTNSARYDHWFTVYKPGERVGICERENVAKYFMGNKDYNRLRLEILDTQAKEVYGNMTFDGSWLGLDADDPDDYPFPYGMQPESFGRGVTGFLAVTVKDGVIESIYKWESLSDNIENLFYDLSEKWVGMKVKDAIDLFYTLAVLYDVDLV